MDLKVSLGVNTNNLLHYTIDARSRPEDTWCRLRTLCIGNNKDAPGHKLLPLLHQSTKVVYYKTGTSIAVRSHPVLLQQVT